MRMKIPVSTTRAARNLGDCLARIRHADIYAELSAREVPIPQNDIAVAAVARELQFGILVGPDDETHFRRVEGVPIKVIPRP